MRNRIYLVDDEQPMLDGLSVSIKKAFPDLEICGMAKSGREALEGISQTRPDIIMLDVRMPGMSGLDILREVRQILPDSMVILLTAYERFDIAQEAYSLGAYKYLVKPLTQELLVGTIRGALLELNVGRETAKRNLESREKHEFARPLIETGFIYALIGGNTDLEFIDSSAEWLGIKKNNALKGHFSILYKEAENIFRQLWYSREEEKRIRQEITNRLDCIIGPVMGRLIPIFTAGEKNDETQYAIEESIKSMNTLGIKFAVGTVEPMSTLRNSWLKLFEAVMYPQKQNDQLEPINEEIQGIIDVAVSGDVNGVHAGFVRWITNQVDNPDNALERSIVTSVAAAFAGGSAEEILAAGKKQQLVNNAINKDAAEEAGHLLTLSLSSILDKEKSDAGKNKIDKRVYKILNFINESYDRQISLEDAADKVGLSPAHVSRLLVSETGISFTEHLSKKRIEKACHELTEGMLSIKEISSLCGYPDSNYFSRAFKKVMGITPSEYTQKHGRPYETYNH
jgi:two-component system response regulator YesN